jgi:hypothetical protein
MIRNRSSVWSASRLLPLILSLAAAVLVPSSGALAQAKKSDGVVKVEVASDKPVDGKQVVTITLHIEKPYHIYANPVGSDDDTFKEAATQVLITGKTKPDDVKIEFPAGKVVKDKDLGDYKVWEDKVVIQATVLRAKGDTGPLQLTLKLQACTDKTCLPPATIKREIP